MTPTILDPRVVAESFQMDTYELAEQLSTWSYTALPGNIWNGDRETFGPMPLEQFDAAVEKARRYLEDAHEAMKAYLADNPPTAEEDE